MPITDKNKMPEIIAQFGELRETVIAVGLVGEAAQWSPGGGANLVDIASFNEFGTSRIPARSFLRSTFDENLPAYEKMLKRLVKTISPKRSAEQAAALLGIKMVADVQAKIVSLTDPPNAPSTIAKKGSSNPLIDTGRMRQSIAYEGRKP